MKYSFRFLPIIALMCVIASVASAQDERNVIEIFGGYSYLRQDLGDLEDIGFDTGVNMHGFNGSVTGNVHKWIGLKFDFSTHSKTLTETDFVPPISVKLRNSQYLGGVQIKNNLKDGPTVKPFAHILAGVSNLKLSCSDCDEIDASISENNFAMVFGGGVDVKVHKNVDIRVFQLDYNPVWFKGNDALGLEGATLNNLRMSFGAVFHW